MDYTKFLKPIPNGGFSCCGCGKTLDKNDLFCDCADCGGIFCESCVKDGTFEDHECESD